MAKHSPFDYYEISRTFRSLGIFELIMLLYKSGWFKWLFVLMRPWDKWHSLIPDAIIDVQCFFWVSVLA